MKKFAKSKFAAAVIAFSSLTMGAHAFAAGRYECAATVYGYTKLPGTYYVTIQYSDSALQPVEYAHMTYINTLGQRYDYKLNCQVPADGPTMCDEKNPNPAEPETFILATTRQNNQDGVKVSTMIKGNYASQSLVGFVPCNYIRN